MASSSPSPVPAPLIPAAQSPKTTKRRFATVRTIGALILREMSTRYGRTPGGYVWAILEPLAAIMVLSIGFSLVIRTPSLGTSFLLFYATGFLPFNLYQTISLTTARAIEYSRPLLRYPAVTWVDAILARFLLNSLTGILVTFLLIGGILIAIDSRTLLDLPVAILSMALAMLLGLGVGVMNCTMMGLFPIWDVVWSIITRPLFIASGILFTYEDLPPMAQEFLWYNPLIHIGGLMRSGFYPTYTASYVSIPFVLFSALILFTAGLILMRRYHRVILNR
ncbi:Polysialic acid transport protein KpsM [Phaeobacter italicus]|jgi:capsular polysaccharide transport system permease protein|uniref:Transport permease protein n=1 Tax=Phaeobacter italicus TaxID=481446 RepID=A0A0H5D1I6_9RHOB|nr:ABC transporter permease [Phaeobacter italicus]CRL10884.1 Polysialic acid transport protein KpsM [Phaeobacter italicus]